MNTKRIITGACAVFVGLMGIYINFFIPQKTDSANFTVASATLSNSRFSYKSGVATGTSGSPTVTIDGGTGNGDNNTAHLFPGDEVCFTNAALSGCIGNKKYTVASVVDSTTFNLTGALTNNLDNTGYVIATQSGSLSLAFKTATEIPLDGDMLITIPGVNLNGKTDDGFPDSGASTAVNGFDITTIATTDITVTGCTNVNWTVTSITAGGASADHQILISRGNAVCAALTDITVTIDATPGIINPAPVTDNTRGVANVYTISLTSRDGSDNTIDSSDVKVAPVEGVLVSATVDEILSLTVAGVSADTGTYCNITRTASSPDTTAAAIPWGTLSPTYLAATHNTQQLLTVSSNASSGYNVYIEENDQMGKDGIACTGNGGESVNCIQDTVCDGTGCTESTLRDWTADPSSYVGLGYSLEDQGADTDAVFEWNDSAAVFNAKQIADIAAGETRASIMTNTGPVDTNQVAVCYRIDISATQPAGYYYNKVKYTLVATF